MKKYLFILWMLVFTTFAGFAQTMHGYEYWFDNDYAGRTTINSSQQEISLSMDIEGINSGLHYLNFRAQGTDGKWGCLSRYIVYINNHANHLSRVDYWLDGKIDGKKSQGVNGNRVLISVDISQMERGKHTFAFQGFTERGSFATLDSLEFEAVDAPFAPMPVISYEGNIISISIADPTTTTLPVFYYTLDGTVPDTTSTKYEGPFEVTHNCVVKSIGILEGTKNSPVDSLVVDWFKVADVEFVQNGNQVLLSTPTESSTIHYSLSTDPTNEFVYSAPVTMAGDCTIEAYATRSGYLNSDTTSFVFRADGVTVAAPRITRLDNTNTISMSTATEQAVIYYTLDGSTPDSTSTIYSQPFEVVRNDTIKAIALRTNYYPSQVTTFVVDWFKVATPTFSWEGDILTISCATEGATILYSAQTADENGVYGVDAFALYEGPFEYRSDALLKARATKDGMEDSDTLTLEYPYTAWQRLLDVCYYSEEVAHRCRDNSNVDQQMVYRLMAEVDFAHEMYVERTAERAEIEDRINYLKYLADELLNQANAVDYTFDYNGVLTISGEMTMADALEAAGGVAEVAKTITAIVWNSGATLTNSDLQGLDNPNMLIYVSDSLLAPRNRDNVIIGDLAKNIVLTDVSEGNGNFYCPREFKAEMISYTHEYRQTTEPGVARGWETIALPFTVQTIMHEKNGLIAPFGNDASGKHFWLRQLSERGLTSATVIEANTPYLISMPNSNEYPAEYNQAGRVTFSAQDTFVPETETYGMEMHGDNGEMIMFLPCFQSQSADEQVYALNVGEQRGSYAEGSVFVANYRAVRPFEAFTVHHGNGPAPLYIPIFDMSNGTTGIEDVRSKMEDGRSDQWYTIDGRRLQQKPSRKGVYILNGQKTVIK